jgi:hypothetical protein
MPPVQKFSTTSAMPVGPANLLRFSHWVLNKKSLNGCYMLLYSYQCYYMLHTICYYMLQLYSYMLYAILLYVTIHIIQVMKHQLSGPCCIGHWVLHLGTKTWTLCRFVQCAISKTAALNKQKRDIVFDSSRMFEKSCEKSVRLFRDCIPTNLRCKHCGTARKGWPCSFWASSLDWLQQCSQVTAFSQVFPDFEGLLHLRKTGSDSIWLKLAREIHGNPKSWHGHLCQHSAPANIYNSHPATLGILNGTKGAIVVTASLRGRLLPVSAWQQHGNTFVRHDPVFHQSA